MARFRFHFHFRAVGANKAIRLPSHIQRLGTNPTRYVTALTRLSAAGSKEAAIALKAILKLSEKHSEAAVMRTLELFEDESIGPVDLHPSARWKMDDAGLLALDLLLVLWQSHRQPQTTPIGDWLNQPFDSDSASRWWRAAMWTFTTFYLKPQLVPELASLVAAPSCQQSPSASRGYILRKLRERFVSFAPPPIAARYR